jgi:hypothetical protein
LERFGGVCAHSCPIALADELGEGLLAGGRAAHRVAVDAQREGRVGVAKFVHDGTGVDAEGDQERG